VGVNAGDNDRLARMAIKDLIEIRPEERAVSFF
jgi:hypothetical protein